MSIQREGVTNNRLKSVPIPKAFSATKRVASSRSNFKKTTHQLRSINSLCLVAKKPQENKNVLRSNLVNTSSS